MQGDILNNFGYAGELGEGADCAGALENKRPENFTASQSPPGVPPFPSSLGPSLLISLPHVCVHIYLCVYMHVCMHVCAVYACVCV